MGHQLIILLIFGTVAIFNWLIRKGAREGNVDKGSPPFTQPRVSRPRQVQSAESEEERTRKFLEALGVPGTAQPPRRVGGPPPQPARPPQPPAPSIQPQARRVVPKQVVVTKTYVPPPVPKRPEFESQPAPAIALTETRTTGITTIGALPSGSSHPSNPAGLQSLLKSASSIRAAIILREVLGPPRSLQPPAGTAGLL